MGIIIAKIPELDEYMYVVVKDGKITNKTNYEECIPGKSIIREMIKAGYKCYKNGKVYRP